MKQLPPLLFGERTASIVRSVNQLQDIVAGVRGWRSTYTALGDKSAFASKTAAITINGTKLTNVVVTAMHTQVEAEQSSTLFVPISGVENRSLVNGKIVSFTPGHTAAFAPEGQYSGKGEQRSILMVDINKQRLRDTWSAMTGKSASLPGDLSAPMSVSLCAGQLKFDQMLRHICALADQLSTAPVLLNRSGLDDVLYRTLATMFTPGELLEGEPEYGINEKTGFNALRDFLMNHINEPITLTDLECFSGLSARTIQYLFARRAGMSPMAWLKRQRLVKARQLLQQPGAVQSITALAFDLCFSSPSRFATEYRLQFGCLPSEDTSLH